jgi:uncharacterized protein (DUF885 family)
VARSNLPNGTACYAAFLCANTTLSRTSQQVFKLGEETVSASLSQAENLVSAGITPQYRSDPQGDQNQSS